MCFISRKGLGGHFGLLKCESKSGRVWHKLILEEGL